MIADAPYTGIGLNTYPFVLFSHYPTFSLGPEPHAHNLLLQAGVDVGLPGLALLVCVLAGFFLSVVQAYRRTSDPVLRAVLAGAGGGVAAWLLFGAADAITLGAKPGAGLWALLALGMAAAQHGTAAYSTSWPRRNFALGGALLLAALLVPLGFNGLARNAATTASLHALSAPDNRAGLEQAAAQLTAVLAHDPAVSRHWFRLAAVQSLLGQHDESIAALRRGVALDVQDGPNRHHPSQALDRWLSGQGESQSEDLLRVYLQWNSRRPDQAWWYLAVAILYDEYLRNPAGVHATVARGLELEAQPRELLTHYRAAATAAP